MFSIIKKNYFLLISTFLILYFFFNLLDGERGLFSYIKKKEILITLQNEKVNLKYEIKDFVNTLSDKKNVTLVALEDVTDPRNIGSIIRSAVSFDIDGLIIKERSFPSESKLLYKIGEGWSDHNFFFLISLLVGLPAWLLFPLTSIKSSLIW